MYRDKDEFVARSRTAFAANPPMSLLELRALVADNAKGIKRRDALSALDSIERLFGQKLSLVIASRKTVRALFASKNAAQLGISEKRYANIRSGIAATLRDFGREPLPITKRIPLAKEWTQLLAQIEEKEHRGGLYRFAAYCSHMAIAPNKVSRETLLGFFEALDKDEVVKKPRGLLKHTIALWNMCQRGVAGWPAVKLASPFDREFIRRPLAEFPKTFQADLHKWENKLLKGDPLDVTAPARPLSPTTVKNDSATLVRFASALVHSGVKANTIRTLKNLVELKHFKLGLSFFLTRFNKQRTPYVAKIASLLLAIAKHHCRLEVRSLAELRVICRRLDAGRLRQMTERNRERLKQFDDSKNVMKLLAFWREERARGLAQRNPHRAAKTFERALAAALLTFCCLRIQNLRTINLSTDVRSVRGKCFLSIDGSKVKNRQSLEFELPKDVAALLAEYLRDHRSRLLGSQGPYLFPGKNGGPRAAITMYNDFITAVRRHTGLVVNPHLMRHVIAKIVVERQPDLAFAMSRVLGHTKINMTMAHYLGTEGRAAGRHIEFLLEGVTENQVLAV